MPYLDSWYPEKSGGTNVNIAPSSWTEQDNGTNQIAIVNSDDEFINQPSVMGALDKYDKAFFGAKSQQQSGKERTILEKPLIGTVIVMEPLLR